MTLISSDYNIDLTSPQFASKKITLQEPYALKKKKSGLRPNISQLAYTENENYLQRYTFLY